jgi:hypothetical protein
MHSQYRNKVTPSLRLKSPSKLSLFLQEGIVENNLGFFVPQAWEYFDESDNESNESFVK